MGVGVRVVAAQVGGGQPRGRPEVGAHAEVAQGRLQVRGRDIAGDDFYKALLRIWLGNKPVQDDLKPALLGKSG